MKTELNVANSLVLEPPGRGEANTEIVPALIKQQ